MRTATILILATLLGLASAAVRADTFLLEGGGRIDGELLNPDQQPRTTYDVRTLVGGRVSLAKERVREVRAQSELEAAYQQFLPKVPDTAEGHWNMAERCAKANLKPQRTFHLERVLKLDPDHVDARHALGYSRVNDRWVQTEQFMLSRGYIRHGGSWVLQQELELANKKNDRDEEVIQWRRKIKMWRTWIVRNRNNGAEGLANIRAIDSKRAAPPLVEFAKSGKEPRQLRLLFIEVLGQLESQVAANMFVDLVLNDPDPAIREACLDQLERFGGASAVPTLVKALGHKENVIVNRAGTALGRLKVEQVTLPLIDALITKHRKTIQTGRPAGGIGASFGDNGINSFSAGGGGPKLVEFPVQNRGVLSALTVMHPVNFVYDQEQWRRWYIQENTPPSMNLRRPID